MLSSLSSLVCCRLKTRLSSLNTRKDQLQSACRKEIERLAYFKRLVKSTSCAGTVVGSEQLLCEVGSLSLAIQASCIA